MLRLRTPLFVILLSLLGVSADGNPPDDSFRKMLVVQTAMARARMLLNDNDGQKAVQVLEENLRQVNGNNEYLGLLRDAYRVYVKDLHLSGQPALANRYFERLCILDPNAASDPVLRAPPRPVEPELAKGIPFPKFRLPKLTNPFVKAEEPKEVPPAAVRARSEQAVVIEDPFDRKFQRETARDVGKAEEHLALGIKEFAGKRYLEARAQFEKAYQIDQRSLEMCREQWAYCMIRCVSDRVEQSSASDWPEMRKQVEGAVTMSPKFAVVGRDVLSQIEQRAKRPQGDAVKLKHLGVNPEGWQVTETPHFRIFHRQDNAFAEQVAQIVERTRLTMYRKWFGIDGIDWQLPCELIMHPDSASYTRMTGESIHSPGHSRIEADLSGRVISRRMDMRCDIRGMLETVLPHEATHTVLAGMFGAVPPPRWLDEGIAILSESEEKLQLYRASLYKNQQESRLFGLKELMELKNYPHASRVSAFYAQSVVLAEFLTAQKGPRVLTEFVKDGMRQGYEAALQRHYGLTFAQLQQQWDQQVLGNPNRFTAQK